MQEVNMGRSRLKANPAKICETLCQKTTMGQLGRKWKWVDHDLRWFQTTTKKHKTLSEK
jgi:hypothetical protein